MSKPNLDAVASLTREEATIVAYLYGCPLEAKPKWISLEDVKRGIGRTMELEWRHVHEMRERSIIYYAGGIKAIALTPAGEVMAKEITA